MTFDKFIEWSFLGIISAGIVWSAGFLQKLSGGVARLNVKLATIIERTENLTRSVIEHNDRLHKLENRKPLSCHRRGEGD